MQRPDTARDRLFGVSAGPYHFQIGVVPVSVRGVHRAAIDDFRGLYVGCERDAAATGAVDIEVRRVRGGRFLIRRYEVWGDGEFRFRIWQTSAVLPHIEWAINWQIALYLPRYLQIHAGVVEVDGQGVLFPAAPGSGKTTLTTGLLARGWRYLSDEFALIDPDTLETHAFPKALCIKEGSFPVLEGLGLGMSQRTVYVKGQKGRVTYVTPDEFGPDTVTEHCPIRHIIFCNYANQRRPMIKTISRADAVVRLSGKSFNFQKFQGRAVDLLAAVARGARCYELASGDIDETCDVVCRAIRG